MATEAWLMDHLFIEVDGTDLPADVMDDLIEATVDSSLSLPDMFTIHLHDEELKWVDSGQFDPGKTVQISALPEGGGRSQVLIKGEITGLEPEFGDGTQATLRVEGYDRSHHLLRGTFTHAYQQMTDSDIAEEIARKASLRAQVDATTEVHPYVLQHNQTPLEFLTERARRIGYEFHVEDKTLHFCKPAGGGSPLELEWGVQLRSFRPRLTLIEQVDEVVVKGWDDKAKQPIMGQATRGQAEPRIGQKQSGAQLASAAFNRSAHRMVVDHCVRNQAEADALAQALLDEISGAFVEAEGACYGQPALHAGKVVKLTALGKKFSGEYFVTAATQRYSAEGGYTTTFFVTGRRPETLYGLIQSPGPAAQTVGGPATALVTNNKDPQDRGRVKVKYPWLADDVESDWVRVASLGAGPGRGFYCLPEINDEVLVVFEQGDIHRPIVVGGLWNGQDKPPLPAGQALNNGKVVQRVLRSRAGHVILLDDRDGAEQIVIRDKTGKNEVILDSPSNTLTINTGKDIKLSAKGDMVLEATGNVMITGNNGVEIKTAGAGIVSVSQTSVNINNGALEVM